MGISTSLASRLRVLILRQLSVVKAMNFLLIEKLM